MSPAGVAREFAGGSLDLALVPWGAAVRHGWEDLVVPGCGISAAGPVFSVFVAWPAGAPLRGPVFADSLSRSSVALFEILRTHHDFFGNEMPPLDVEAASPDPRQARLLIGDPAIEFRRAHSKDWQFIDLAEAWVSATGLPFVFAVWVAKSQPLLWQKLLRENRDRNLAQIGEWTRSWPDQDFWLWYYSQIGYEIGPAESAGMEHFRRLFLDGESLRSGSGENRVRL